MPRYQEILYGDKHGKGRFSTTLDDFKDAKELIEKGIVVVDIDVLDSDIIEALITKFSITTQYRLTDKGIHLWYYYDKKLPTEQISGLGFLTEYKTREVVVKRQGEERQIFNEGNIQDLPNFFKPVRGTNLQGLSDGEGRYNKMFAHHVALIKNNVENKPLVMTFINDFILEEPLSEAQLSNAQKMTDSSVVQYLEEPHERAKFIMDSYNPVMYNNTVYIRINDYWRNGENEIRAFLYEVFNNLKTFQIDEIYKQIYYRLGLSEKEKEYDVVKLQNGVLKNGKFIEVDYKEFTPYFIELPYNEDLECPEVDLIMDKITGGNKEYQEYVYSMVAQSFNLNFKKRSKQPFFHILYGEGGNGKSILMKLISEIFNDNSASSVKPHQFEHNSNVFTLFGKLVNISDDIKNEPLKDDTLDIIKNTASCDKISIREIYKTTQNMKRIHANLIFSSNHLLSSWEKGTSFTRRIRWLPFNEDIKSLVENGEIPEETFDVIYSDKGIKYFFKKVVEHYFKVYEHGFKEVDVIEKFNKEYHQGNDNTSIFISDLKKEAVIGNTPKSIYDDYSSWCESQDYKPASKKRLTEAISKTFNVENKVKKINGVSCRQYVERGD